MERLDFNALAFGVIAFVILSGVAFALVNTVFGNFLFWLFYAAPVASGAVTGHLARQREFVSLVTLGASTQ